MNTSVYDQLDLRRFWNPLRRCQKFKRADQFNYKGLISTIYWRIQPLADWISLSVSLRADQ